MAMYCYFDGSTSETSQWLTLAGYAAQDSLRRELQPNWEQMLRERYPIAPYIHMTDLLSNTDPFERLAGWTDERIDELIWDALKLLVALDKSLFRSFVCRIDMEAHARVASEGHRIESPLQICAECCLCPAMEWYVQRFGLDTFYVFYDRGEGYFKPLRRWWLAETAKGATPNEFWRRIGDMQPVDMHKHPLIQAADMVAWAESRSTSTREPLRYRYLARVIWDTIPQSAVVIDEALIRDRLVLS
jgi:hypothetical protein